VVCLFIRGHLGGEIGKTTQTGHFGAKLVCYSPRFQGWAWGQGVLWAKNQSGCARETRDHPSVVRLIFRGHLGGQTSETVRTGCVDT